MRLTTFETADDLHWQDEMVTEFVLVVWTASLVLDEISQIFVGGAKVWRSQFWNLLDTAMLSLFIAAFAIRYWFLIRSEPFTMDDLRVVSTILGIDAILFTLRLLNVYSISYGMGTLILIVIEMLSDIWRFLFILIIFLLGFGVAFEAVQFYGQWQQENLTSTQWWFRILLRPYLQMYGELFFDEISGQCTPLESYFGCGYANGSAVVLLAIMMLLVSILLVNLLIAMMSETYSRVQGKAREIWEYKRYRDVSEFEDMSQIPPPFSIAMWILRGIFLALHKILPVSRRILALRESSKVPAQSQIAHTASAKGPRFLIEARKLYMKDNRDPWSYIIDGEAGDEDKLAKLQGQINILSERFEIRVDDLMRVVSRSNDRTSLIMQNFEARMISTQRELLSSPVRRDVKAKVDSGLANQRRGRPSSAVDVRDAATAEMSGSVDFGFISVMNRGIYSDGSSDLTDSLLLDSTQA
jgi:hypothetical protein